MMDKQVNQSVVQTLIDLKNLLDRLLIRGISAIDDESVQLLTQAQQLFAQQGAAYLAGCIQALLLAIDSPAGQSKAQLGRKLLRLQTALFLFERLFTQSVCLADFDELD